MRCLLLLLFFLLCLDSWGQIPSFERDPKKFRNFLRTGQLGSYAFVPHSPEFNLQDNFTIELIVRFDNPISSQNGVIMINTMGPNGGEDWGFGFINNPSSGCGFHVCNSSPSQVMANQSDTLSGCKWYHLAGVKKGTSIKFYLNGVLKATNTFSGPIRTATGPMQFGYHRSPYTHWNNGNMDEFRLWNFAKTELQIQTQMNDTLLGNEAGLRAYYKFNESGEGGDITIRNSSLFTGSSLDGKTISSGIGFPKLTNTETLPYPLPPVVPAQPTFCKPGGNFLLSVTSPPGQNSSRFYWFQSNEDTTRIPNTIRSQYLTPFLGQTDTFFVSAVNAQFCESRKVPVLAKVFTPPSASLSVIKTDSCSGTTGTLLVTPLADASYKWYQGPSPTGPFLLANQNSNSLPFSVSEGTTFWTSVQITASPCPSLEIPAIVSVLKEPQTRIVPVDSQACYPLLNSYSFLATGEVGSSFRWSATGAEIQAGGQTDRVKVSWISSPALLTVVQTTQQGCSDTASFNPCLKSTDPLFIPNLITAGTDGRNDSFEIKNLLQYPPCRIQIYNRWGKEVFQSDAYQNNWVGEGPGLYYYLFEVEKKKYQGWVEVVK